MQALVTRCIACWLVLLLLCAWHPPKAGEPFTTEVIGVERIRKEMSLPGVEVDVIWVECGHVNAFYFSSIGLAFGRVVFPRTVALCKELTQINPAIARWIMAHEMAHAIIHQLQIPVTGSEEAAADELAAVYLGLVGRTDDLLIVAEHWFNSNRAENPFGSHPSDMRRGIMALCMATGQMGQPWKHCRGYEWQRAVWTWQKLLNEPL